MKVVRLFKLNNGEGRRVCELGSSAMKLKVESQMVHERPVRSNKDAFNVIAANLESDMEQVPPERFTRNVSEEIDVKCDLVISRVVEDSIR